MEPVSTIIVLAKFIGISLLFIWAWQYIRDIFSEVIIPFLRDKVSPILSDAVAQLIIWIDEPVTVVKLTATQTLSSLKKYILSIEAKYRRISPSTVLSTTTLHTVDKDLKVKKFVRETEIRIDDLPPEVRAELIRNHGVEVVQDVRKTFIDGATEKLKLES